MALVCDIKSNAEEADNDLEDGEIEDDDEEVPPAESVAPQTQPPPAAVPISTPVTQAPIVPPFKDRLSPARTERRKHEDRKKAHLTEAEKSVMFLHKLERAERERKERYKKEMAVDDFASNIQKQIAMVLRKERSQEKDDEPTEGETVKRGRKRKKKDKDKKKHKEQKMESPKRDLQDMYDDEEMMQMKGGSPERGGRNFRRDRGSPPHYDSDGGMDDPMQMQQHMGGMNKQQQQQNMRKRMRGNEGGRNRNRICLFYLQGKCQKSEDCGYSHDACLPMKLELCKFYLMDCCAKGDKCLYLHSEFPCKFYHTGLPCYEGEKCKFAHGKPLTDAFKQILFKHIETAPKEILGEFPRLSREVALTMINTTQKNLEVKYNPNNTGNSGSPKSQPLNSQIPSLFDINVSMPPEMPPSSDPANVTAGGGTATTTTTASGGGKPDKPGRKSRWQDCDPLEAAQAIQKLHQQQIQQQLQQQIQQQQQQQIALGFATGLGVWKDQDMRINSNGDVDMRALPPIIPPPQILSSVPAPAPIPQILVPNVPPPQICSPTPAPASSTPSSLSIGPMDLPPPIINPSPAAATAAILPQQQAVLQPAAIPPQPAEIPASISDLNEYKASAVPSAVVVSVPANINVSSSSLLSNASASEDTARDEQTLSIVEEPEPAAATTKSTTTLPEQQQVGDVKVQAATTVVAPVSSMNDDYDSDGNEHELTIDEKLDEVPLQHLPKKQRELFLRIQGLQKDNMPDAQQETDEQSDKEDWYSDDDDDDAAKSSSAAAANLPAPIKSMDMMEKLGDLSKIDISAEVSKLLSTISQHTHSLQQSSVGGGTAAAQQPTPVPTVAAAGASSPSSAAEPPTTPKVIRDPRLLGATASASAPQGTVAEATIGGEAKSSVSRVSIYEQGSISLKDQKEMEERRKKQDVDLRNIDTTQNLDLDMRTGSFGDTDLRQIGRSDVDLRQLNLPFKSMANYTPATEIDGSYNSASPMVYKVHIIDIPRPDYTGLKLSAQDAMMSGDPRLRKIFRLSVDEKESPASPPPKPASPPKPSTRVDPRRRGKTGGDADSSAAIGALGNPMQAGFPMDNAAAAMSYNQQLNLIQNSAFYQSLTPSQKLLFNQEIATKVNKSANDPILSGIMSSLGLSQAGQGGGMPPGAASVNGGAMNILSNVNNVVGGPMGAGHMPMGVPPNMAMGPAQPGLLGAAPGIPNMGGAPPPDFQINLDPRNGGLLGQAPFPPFAPDNPGNFQQYNDNDFYPNEPPNFVGGNHPNNMGGGGNNGNNRNENRHFRERDNNRGGRRGRSWNNRHNNNNRNYNRSRNRSNRSHSPP